MATRTRQRIDINSASAQEIERACGIDSTLAERLVAYREQHGPFKAQADLDAVPGFAEVRTEQVLSVVDLPSSKPATRRRAPGAAAKSEGGRQGSHGASSGARAPRRATRGASSSESQAAEGSRSTRRSRSAEPVTDHDFIRRWVEERGGWPARVKGTGRSKNDTGMIRIDFPGFSGKTSLERIEWDEWFAEFDANELAFLHRDMRHRDGELDRFNKLIRRG